jgi:hypothetical protein
MSATVKTVREPEAYSAEPSKLLISEHPLQVLPSLAISVGLNEAIVLQQLHYWMLKSNYIHDGHRWVYNSYEQWQVQFPFWSIPTIQRIFTSLEKQNVIESSRLSAQVWNQCKWYTINYAILKKLGETKAA